MEFITDARVAAGAIAAGHLAALPTETVYGLGANADDANAIAQVYSAKGRPGDHPLIVHVIDAQAMESWVRDVPDYARRLAEQFWPGPLTLVLPRSQRARDFITGGQDSVAVRVPSHALAQRVLAELAQLTDDPSIGIAAPSANRFGHVSPTTAQHVTDELANFLSINDVILDGGPCAVGVESTIVDCTGLLPIILRPGFVTQHDIEQCTGMSLDSGSSVRASGTLDSHYSPAAHVILINDDESLLNADSGFIALSSIDTPLGLIRVAKPETIEEYATVLYSALREADARSLKTVYVVPPTGAGLAAAIRDRLTRAAHELESRHITSRHIDETQP